MSFRSGSVYRSFNVGISLKSNEDMQIPSSEVSEPWRLVPLSKIIQNISLETTHLLMLDLEGSEWDVFDCILSTPELDRMKYIGLKLRSAVLYLCSVCFRLCASRLQSPVFFLVSRRHFCIVIFKLDCFLGCGLVKKTKIIANFCYISLI